MDYIIPGGLLLLIILTVVIRLPFIMTENSDDWATFYRIKKQKGHRWPHYDLDDSLVEGFLGAPRLQYYLVSFFPERLWGVVGNVLNIVYELMSVLITYALAFWIFDLVRIDNAGLMALYAALLFTTSPVLFSITPRLTGVKARTLGTLLILAYFALFGTTVYLQEWWLLAGCVILGIAAILASAFAMQNLVFLSVALTIFYQHWLPVTLMVAVFVIGWFFPKFSIKKVLLHKLNHYWWYKRSYKGTTAQSKNSIADFFRIPVYLFTNRRKFLNQIFVKQSVVVVAYSVPVIWILGYYLWSDAQYAQLTDHVWTEYLLYLSLGGACTFLLTALRPFLFLGEAERYFEYAVPYMSILTVFLFHSSGMLSEVVLLLVLFQVIILLTFFIYNEKGRIKRGMAPLRLDDHLREVIDFLKKTDEEKRILTIPVKYGYVIAYFFKKGEVKVYQTFATHKLDGFRYLSEDLAKYNFPKDDFEYYKSKYKVNILLIPKDYYFKSEYDYSKSLESLTPAFENERFMLFHI